MSTTAVDVYSQLGLTRPAAETRRTELGQGDFLTLMTEQLKNQDPLKPLGSQEFLGQLAQFSTVSGIDKLQNTMVGLANVMGGDQLLGAASLVDKQALVESDVAQLDQVGGITGAVDMTQSGMAKIEIKDATGKLIKRIDLTNLPAGTNTFTWDGTGEDGVRAPAGLYTINAVSNEKPLTTLVNARVDSVSVSAQGPVLNLNGIGAVPLTQIRQIGRKA